MSNANNTKSTDNEFLAALEFFESEGWTEMAHELATAEDKGTAERLMNHYRAHQGA